MAKFVLRSFSAILAFAGIGKIVSYFGVDRVLYLPDPILGIQFRYLFLIAGIVELTVSIYCFVSREAAIPQLIVAILATNIGAYRVALWFIGWHRPCNCMGSFTQILHISGHTSDMIMKVILGYMLIASYTLLLWRRRHLKAGYLLSAE